MIRRLPPLYPVVLLALFLWVLVIGATRACAEPFFTFDCTPASDKVTTVDIQVNNLPVVNVPAVMTCGAGPDKVVCTGDQRTVCYDAVNVPVGPFSAKALVRNAWGGASDYGVPLVDTKAVPTSRPFMRILTR